MDAAELLATDSTNIWHPYAPAPNPVPAIIARSTHGTRIQASIPGCFSESGDPEEVELIDGMSSWWAAAFGHGNAKLKEAAQQQIETMSHVMFGGITHEPAVALATQLIDMTPAGLNKVFFADSGSISVEVALKMVFQYQQGIGHPERNRMLTWRGGYHGDTFATMSVCDPEGGMHARWNDLVMDHVFAPLPPARGASATQIAEYLTEFEQLVDPSIAGVIIEPVVQGAGGMRFHDPALVAGVKEICERHGILLVADEIATGFGRTGSLFACEAAGITPDVMCVGKALTGGFMTLAAALTTDAVAAAIASPAGGGALMHGPTFMANPLACRVASAAMELVAEGHWRTQVPAIEGWLEENLAPLREHPAVADVRVQGAIGVVELHSPVDMATATKAAISRGVWLRPFGKLVYTMPPYISTKEEVEAMCAAIAEVCRTHQG